MEMTDTILTHNDALGNPEAPENHHCGENEDTNTMSEHPDQSAPETMADRKARLAAWKEQKMKAAAEKQKNPARQSTTLEKKMVAPEPSYQQQRVRQPVILTVSESLHQRDLSRNSSPKCGESTPTGLANGSKREAGPRIPFQQRPNRRDSSESPAAAVISPSQPIRTSSSNCGGGAQPQASRAALSSSGSGLSWPGSASCGGDDDEARYEVLQAELLQWQYANLRLEQVCPRASL
jgi:hypothetical protein